MGSRRPLAVAAAGLTLAACGGSSSVTILNTERVERAIEQSIRAQRSLSANVSCPSGVHQGKGLDFICTATVRRRNYPVSVKQLDDQGHVSYVVR